MTGNLLKNVWTFMELEIVSVSLDFSAVLGNI